MACPVPVIWSAVHSGHVPQGSVGPGGRVEAFELPARLDNVLRSLGRGGDQGEQPFRCDLRSPAEVDTKAHILRVHRENYYRSVCRPRHSLDHSYVSSIRATATHQTPSAVAHQRGLLG